MSIDILKQFSDVIKLCLDYVNKDAAFNAEPWILLEEKSGFDATLELYESCDYKILFYLVEDYCLAAQRGLIPIESELFKKVTALILECSDHMEDAEYILNKLAGNEYLIKLFRIDAG